MHRIEPKRTKQNKESCSHIRYGRICTTTRARAKAKDKVRTGFCRCDR